MTKWILAFWMSCCFLQGYAQLNTRSMSGYDHFEFPGLRMAMTNGFIINPGDKYSSPNYISEPFNKKLIDVYGPLLNLSVFKMDSLVALGDHHGSFFTDTVTRDRPLFDIDLLEARVSKNGTVLRDWQKVTTMKLFEDSSVRLKSDSNKFQPCYFVLHDSLEIGDSINVLFRTGNKPGFLEFTARRKDAYTRPLLMVSAHDTGNILFDFSRYTVYNFQNDVTSNSQQGISIKNLTRGVFLSHQFYDYWPEHPGPLIMNGYKANENILFNFRQEKKDGKNVSFVYRLLGGTESEGRWKQTYGLVYFPTIKENSNYRLEVKYADGHGEVATYLFSTPPNWYQTTLFKILIATAIAVILISIILWFLFQKRKRRQQKLELELQSIYSQMNPHFLFNALGSIQGLMNDDRIDQANQYLTGFASLLRSSISEGRKTLVPLSGDLKTLENYIALERLRTEFDYRFEIEEQLKNEQIELPPMLVQPLIENAIKHGLHAGRGLLEFLLQKKGTDLLVLIRDNGPGFDPSKPSTGQGIRLTRHRIALFNRMHKGRTITLDIRSSASGTEAAVRFVNWLSHD